MENAIIIESDDEDDIVRSSLFGGSFQSTKGVNGFGRPDISSLRTIKYKNQPLFTTITRTVGESSPVSQCLTLVNSGQTLHPSDIAAVYGHTTKKLFARFSCYLDPSDRVLTNSNGNTEYINGCNVEVQRDTELCNIRAIITRGQGRTVTVADKIQQDNGIQDNSVTLNCGSTNAAAHTDSTSESVDSSGLDDNILDESKNFLTNMEYCKVEATKATLHQRPRKISLDCFKPNWCRTGKSRKGDSCEVIKIESSDEEDSPDLSTDDTDKEVERNSDKCPTKRPRLAPPVEAPPLDAPLTEAPSLEEKPVSDAARALRYLMEKVPMTLDDEKSVDDLKRVLLAGLSMIDPLTIISALDKLSETGTAKLRANVTKLCQYCKYGQLDRVLGLLVQGCSPIEKITGLQLKAPLHIAAEEGHLDIMICLVYKSGGVVDIPDLYQKTPLHVAVTSNKKDVAEFLRIAGASMSCRDFEGVSLIHVAANNGHTSLINWLVENSVDVDTTDSKGLTSLMGIMSNEDVETMKLLMKHGANVLRTDECKNVALHWACYFGAVECAEILLKFESTLNLANIFGDTPLHVAARQGKLKVAQLLLEHGADTSVRNNAGHMPMEVEDISRPLYNLIKSKHNVNKTGGAYLYLNDISNGKEKIPISLINEVDSATLPDFRYMTEIIPTQTVSVKMDFESVQCCDCDTICEPSSCLCLATFPGVGCYYKDNIINPKACEDEGFVIFECTPYCSCRPTCKNRLVQRGITYPLQMFRSKEKGWGIRTLADIPVRAFVLPYKGELISSEEADSRADDTYLFDLSYPGTITGNCIDAKRCGNVGRFLNHSCSANLFSMLVLTNHRDAEYPGVAFFAKRDIKKMEELTFDYGEKYWEAKMQTGVLCLCNEQHCHYKRRKMPSD